MTKTFCNKCGKQLNFGEHKRRINEKRKAKNDE